MIPLGSCSGLSQGLLAVCTALQHVVSILLQICIQTCEAYRLCYLSQAVLQDTAVNCCGRRIRGRLFSIWGGGEGGDAAQVTRGPIGHHGSRAQNHQIYEGVNTICLKVESAECVSVSEYSMLT